MSEWYNDLKSEDFGGKHVVVTLDDGMTISGALSDTYGLTAKKENDTCSAYIFMAETVPVITGSYTSPKCLAILVCMEDNRWRPLDGITSVDLVWDERDWKRIKLSDAGDGDVLVVRGELYPITEAHFVDDPAMPIWWSVASDSYIVAPDMVSCALRRKVSVPVKPGFYKDTLGEFWARAAKSTDDGPWRSVEPDALDQPAKSDKYMSNLMPLTPVHFESGRAA